MFGKTLKWDIWTKHLNKTPTLVKCKMKALSYTTLKLFPFTNTGTLGHCFSLPLPQLKQTDKLVLRETGTQGIIALFKLRLTQL